MSPQMMLDTTRMEELVTLLNEACKLYYTGAGEPIISDRDYDKHVAELRELEHSTGIRLPNSPLAKVGYEEDGCANKVKHHSPILSLKDTKDIEELKTFLGDREGVLSWKLDGVAIVLYYENGELVRALSRGDGHYGKDITKNVLKMPNVPKTVPTKTMMVVRGEGCIRLDEFEQIKRTKEGERYSNPRNLASGLVNGTRTTSTLLRHVRFITHSLVFYDNFPWEQAFNEFVDKLYFLERQGFDAVDFAYPVGEENLKKTIRQFTKDVENYAYPVDGLVLTLNDITYGESLGATAKWPKHSLAFKWPDVYELTKVTGMDWSVSKTGLITPIVIFEPVKLEGTVIKRASLHSLKIFEALAIGKGDILKIYKANKIIPEVEENMTRSGTMVFPKTCPVCGAGTVVELTPLTKKLYCYECRRR